MVAFLACLIAAAAAAALLAGRGFGPRPPRHGDEIVIGGVPLRIGTPVVLWFDPGGHDATQPHCDGNAALVLPSRPSRGCATPERIGRRAGGDDPRETVTQFVLHYDMASTSRNCFRILHDVRGLSVHFLLDLDGTIYQTCDVAARARHARAANDRSVGVEIAHPGPLEDTAGLALRYRRDEGGVRFDPPPSLGPHPLRTAGFIARPARPEPIRGTVHGRVRTQYDFTGAQYEALARLAAGLARALPRLRLEAPRGEDGRVLDRVFPDPDAAAAFSGVVGHYHLQADKIDPGPAFDWERFLEAARRLLLDGAP